MLFGYNIEIDNIYICINMYKLDINKKLRKYCMYLIINFLRL